MDNIRDRLPPFFATAIDAEVDALKKRQASCLSDIAHLQHQRQNNQTNVDISTYDRMRKKVTDRVATEIQYLNDKLTEYTSMQNDYEQLIKEPSDDAWTRMRERKDFCTRADQLCGEFQLYQSLEFKIDTNGCLDVSIVQRQDSDLRTFSTYLVDMIDIISREEVLWYDLDLYQNRIIGRQDAVRFVITLQKNDELNQHTKRVDQKHQSYQQFANEQTSNELRKLDAHTIRVDQKYKAYEQFVNEQTSKELRKLDAQRKKMKDIESKQECFFKKMDAIFNSDFTRDCVGESLVNAIQAEFEELKKEADDVLSFRIPQQEFQLKVEESYVECITCDGSVLFPSNTKIVEYNTNTRKRVRLDSAGDQ